VWVWVWVCACMYVRVRSALGIFDRNLKLLALKISFFLMLLLLA